MVFIHPKILDSTNQEIVTQKLYDDIRQQQLQKVDERDFNKGTIALPENLNHNKD